MRYTRGPKKTVKTFSLRGPFHLHEWGGGRYGVCRSRRRHVNWQTGQVTGTEHDTIRYDTIRDAIKNQKSTGIDMEQNCVTVTLCRPILVTAKVVDLKPNDKTTF